jgi:hypothetical protein
MEYPPLTFGKPKHYWSVLTPPEIVGRETCLAKVTQLSAISAGKELDGMPNVEVVRELFRLDSKKWQQLTEVHLDEVWNVVSSVLCSLTRHVANETTAQRIIRNIINVDLDLKRSSMTAKLQDLLAPHLRCHLITYNPALKRKVQSLKEIDIARGIPSTPELDTLYHVTAYYEVSIACPSTNAC